ncbi:MAG: hypothetical protein JSS49_02995 [Planctomycetes bacterium]|nr:hypothetical protein [Planctomycetota bacterium]
MMLDLWQRLQREVKANRQKAGLLAGLFLFGCCFWVPMVARAVGPKKAAAAAHIANPALTTPVANQLPSATAPTAADQEKFWANLSRALAEDSMFQSADVQGMNRDPFLAENHPTAREMIVEQPSPKVDENAEDVAVTLELTSTVIGRARRAALINGQLYQLGRKFEANGRSYVVSKIESNRVQLQDGEEMLELTLARTQLSDVLERRVENGSMSAAPANQ